MYKLKLTKLQYFRIIRRLSKWLFSCKVLHFYGQNKSTNILSPLVTVQWDADLLIISYDKVHGMRRYMCRCCGEFLSTYWF